jgi:hypothetical protein
LVYFIIKSDCSYTWYILDFLSVPKNFVDLHLDHAVGK